VCGPTDQGYPVAGFDHILEKLGCKVAARDNRQVDAAQAGEEPQDPAVAQAEIGVVIELVQLRFAMDPDDMIDIGGNHIFVGGGRSR